jgi:hypothetical protein
MKHNHLYGERAKCSEAIDYVRRGELARNNLCAVA